MSCTSTTDTKNNVTADSIHIPVRRGSLATGQLQGTVWYCPGLQLLEGHGPWRAVVLAKLARQPDVIFQSCKYSVSAYLYLQIPKSLLKQLILKQCSPAILNILTSKKENCYRKDLTVMFKQAFFNSIKLNECE